MFRDITIVESLCDSTLDMDTMELDSKNTTIISGAMNALFRNEVTPGRTSTPMHNKSEMSALTTTLKKKMKLSCVAARDKLMVMRDSDVSSLDTESDSVDCLFTSIMFNTFDIWLIDMYIELL